MAGRWWVNVLANCGLANQELKWSALGDTFVIHVIFGATVGVAASFGIVVEQFWEQRGDSQKETHSHAYEHWLLLHRRTDIIPWHCDKLSHSTYR